MLLTRQIARKLVDSSRRLHTSNILQKAQIIDGKKIARQIECELKADIEAWVNAGNRPPKIAAIIVGDHPASKIYVNRKMKSAESIGISAITMKLDSCITQEQLMCEIDSLNSDPSIDGIIVQLPLPGHINEREASQAVIPCKDVDGFHLENIGNLTLDTNGLFPATAVGVKELIVRSNIETHGKNAVVVGRSKHVGLPIAMLLHADGKGQTGALDMTTTICHRHTPPEDLVKYTKLADVLVTAAGVPGLITGDMVKPGACVIDVGITRVETGPGKSKVLGDVHFESVQEVAGHITPVPGGVGPMTVAMLMKNTVYAAVRNKKNEASSSQPVAASALSQ